MELVIRNVRERHMENTGFRSETSLFFFLDDTSGTRERPPT